MNKDPWETIASPAIIDSVNARRVDAGIKWNFFWASSSDYKYLLILSYNSISNNQIQLPKLQHIEVKVSDNVHDLKQILILKLLKSSHKDLFYKLCMDVINSTLAASSENQAVSLAINRLWRWHHLLRNGNDGLLSLEEQQGLIGELRFMEKFLLPYFSASDSVNAWYGPLGHPKDFVVGKRNIEVKTRNEAGAPYISINSENQLDTDDTDILFLYVLELKRSSLNSEGFSISDLVKRIYEKLAKGSGDSLIEFEKRLAAAGFRWEDDYSDFYWIEGQSHIYKVEDEFPRITSRMVLSGVSKIRYSISMAECKKFLTTENKLIFAIGGNNGN